MKDNSKEVLVSVIIPLFNEEHVFDAFTRRLCRILNGIVINYEIIFIDDGSDDGTFQEIKAFADQNVNCIGVQFTRNFGKEAALLAGLEHMSGQVAVILDGDGQHPPELIPEMIRCWMTGEFDIVSAYKNERQNDSLYAKISATIFNKLMRILTGLDLTNSSDYKLLDKRVVNSLLRFVEKGRFFRGLTAWTGYREKRVFFSVEKRMAGTSSWSNIHLIRLALKAITSHTAKPLTAVLGFGFLGLAVSLVLIVQALYAWYMGLSASGWASLTLVIIFFGSANLFAVGIVGQYLAQVFDEVKNRPAYFVQQIISNKEKTHTETE